ncbi:arginase family protein [Anderseniella sp. Alg231-50]|uniref:arginase family protein n=1 Tax=Anderseniella sp. Alg231-50 TaxID=1922226 RepID=UPI000D5537A7
MKDVRIASPMFLDRRSDAVAAMSRPGDRVIAAGPGSGDQTDSLAPIHRELAETVSGVVAGGDRPFAILGDCCQAIPVMAGLERTGLHPTLVWLDSHGDFNTWGTTPSGFLGGMPLAMLTGRGDQRMMQAVELSPIDDSRVVLCDGRDLDPGERTLVEGSGIVFIDSLDDLDPGALPQGPLYVHFDSDIIDANEAPAFLYPAKGGPSAEAMRHALEQLLATGRVGAISTTVGWDVARDSDGVTRNAVDHALKGLQPG